MSRVADLARAQMAAMNARAQGEPRRLKDSEERTTFCIQRLSKAALALDRVLLERGDENGRRLVEGALRLASGS